MKPKPKITDAGHRIMELTGIHFGKDADSTEGLIFTTAFKKGILIKSGKPCWVSKKQTQLLRSSLFTFQLLPQE